MTVSFSSFCIKIRIAWSSVLNFMSNNKSFFAFPLLNAIFWYIYNFILRPTHWECCDCQRNTQWVIVYISTTMAGNYWIFLNIQTAALSIFMKLLMLLMPESAQLLLQCEGNYLLCRSTIQFHFDIPHLSVLFLSLKVRETSVCAVCATSPSNFSPFLLHVT